MLKYLIVLTIGLIAFGCTDEGPDFLPRQTIPVYSAEQLLRAGTDQNLYFIGDQITISLYNGSDSIIYIPTCAGQISYYIQMDLKGSWQDTGANGLPCIGFNHMGTITIPPGRTYRYTDYIVHFGQYRFLYPVTIGQSDETVWLYTNDFEVNGQ